MNQQFFRQPTDSVSATLPPGFFTTRINIPIGSDPGPTTTASPFAPFLNLLGSPPPFQLPTLPTLPPPATTTTPTPVNICTLPPVTGNCSKARIMWQGEPLIHKCQRLGTLTRKLGNVRGSATVAVAMVTVFQAGSTVKKLAAENIKCNKSYFAWQSSKTSPIQLRIDPTLLTSSYSLF